MAHPRLLLVFVTSLALTACDHGSGNGSSDDDAAGTEGRNDDGGSDGQADDGADGADGADADGGNDGGGNDDSADLDAVEAACEADCEAQLATECAPPNQNILTCKLQCASATVQMGDFCLGEYTASVQCRADGGYECAYDYPTPRSTCATEQLAYTDCMTDIGCKRSCDAAIDAGCGGDSFEGCLDACITEKNTFEGTCSYYYDNWHLCEAQAGIECVDGQPTTTGDCTYAIANVADCIYDGSDPCAGYCFVAEQLGCGAGCSADCSSRINDATCGSDFDSLIGCELLHGEASCGGDYLMPGTICDYENERYQTCLAGGG